MARLALLAVICVLLSVAAEAIQRGPPVPGVPAKCLRYRHSRIVKIRNSAQLNSAIRGSRAGDLIVMAPGRYSSDNGAGDAFNNKNGNKFRPITLCGPRTAVIDNGCTGCSTIFTLRKSSYINIVGMTLKNGLKAIMTEGIKRCKFDGVYISEIGMEAIHLKENSHMNMIYQSTIINTGRVRRETGEGVYIGSDDQLGVDRCFQNMVLNNRIGPGVTADGIDIKQFTYGGIIKGNILDGRSLCGCNSATSVINVKGNSYKIIGNVGRNSVEDMFKVAKTNSGQGRNNYFSGNRCLSGLRRGYQCVRVPDFGGGNTSPNRVSCGQRTNARCNT